MNHMREFLKNPMYKNYRKGINLRDRISHCEKRIEYIMSDAYIDELRGTIGADPMVLDV